MNKAGPGDHITQTVSSGLKHKSSAVFGTAIRKSFTEEQAMKSVGLGPAAYDHLLSMKNAILVKVKGQHAMH